METVVTVVLATVVGFLFANLIDHAIWPRESVPPLALMPRTLALLVLFVILWRLV